MTSGVEIKHKMKILVLMSVYNGAKYIAEQIESIMKQKVQADVALRIRDDGSNDCSRDIVKQCQEEYPERIELIEGQNIGVNASFFDLIDSAKGYDYYALSDQDDVWLPDKLQTAIDFLAKEDNTQPLLYGSTSYVTTADLTVKGRTRRQQRPFNIYNTLVQTICPGHNQFFNNALLKKIQEPRDLKRIYMYDLWTTNIAMLFGKIIFNNEPHTYYRQHKSNELGYKESKVMQLMRSWKHASVGRGRLCRIEIEYLAEKYEQEYKKAGCYEEICRYVNAKNFWQRLKYVLSSKLWRQSKIETLALYVAIVMGKF